ncbi:hypothetical protein [Streptomyces sp. NPDC006638]|uniref:hypothetical protein n=1 Tax=Streptomyces sp. NPDC006638 TaxID=3157183 RepID=UPI0033A5D13B
MIILTGPQTSTDELGDLIEAAGLIGAQLTCSSDVDWALVERFYCLAGWDACPLAVADVGIAAAFGFPVELLD